MELIKNSITSRLDKKTLIFLPTLILAIALSGCGGEMDSGPSDNPSDPAPGVPRPANQCYSAGGNSGHSAILNSQGNAYPVETGMLALNGDQVTIQPVAVVREESTTIPPMVSRIDNQVCVQTVDVCAATVPVIQSKCHNSCHFNYGSCNGADFGNSQICCTTKQCVRQQDQWTETSFFPGLDSPKSVEDRAPMRSPKSVEALLSGLKVRFSSSDDAGNTKSVDCPLSSSQPAVAAEKFTFQVHDVTGCPPIFADHPERPRTVGLINQMSESISYPTGSLVKTWDGRVLEKPTQTVYLPEIDLSTTVGIQAGS
jgi:hypothetical protein